MANSTRPARSSSQVSRLSQACSTALRASSIAVATPAAAAATMSTMAKAPREKANMAATAVVAPYDFACSISRNRKRTMPAVKTAKARPSATTPQSPSAPCETSPHATEQSREGEGPQPGCALAFLLLALLPSSLDANDQADGKGDGEALDEFEGVHGLPCFPNGIAVTSSTWCGLERRRLDPYQCWGADAAATVAIPQF